MSENFTALFAVFFTLGLPVLAIVAMRVFKHRERMELLRRGIVPPDLIGKRGNRGWSQAYTAPSAAMPQGAVPPPGWGNPDDDPQRALFKGIRIAFVGLAIFIGLSFIPHDPRSLGGPWLLGGLIPMFVGIAQIIIALLSGAQLPGVLPRATVFPPPNTPPGMPPPPPGFGSQGMPWQPQQPGRSRFEELSKPVPPPDVR